MTGERERCWVFNDYVLRPFALTRAHSTFMNAHRKQLPHSGAAFTSPLLKGASGYRFWVLSDIVLPGRPIYNSV